jgi:hypothetical protein
MTEQIVRVECYSGHKAEERPLRILFEGQTLEIEEIEDRWYSPGATCQLNRSTQHFSIA